MRTQFTFTATLLYLFFFTQSVGSTAFAINIYGKDDRLIRNAAKLSALKPIVKIKGNFKNDNAVGNCTGSLIAEDLVLTAKHCATTEIESLKVLTGYHEGSYLASANVTNIFFEGSLDPNESKNEGSEHDWAILKIDQPLGKKFGILPIAPEENLSVLDKISAFIFPEKKDTNLFVLAGYSCDLEKGEKLSVDPACHVFDRSVTGALLFHDCDSSGGSSGAPLLKCENNLCTIVGLHVGHYYEGNPKVIHYDRAGIQNANYAIDLRVQKKFQKYLKTF